MRLGKGVRRWNQSFGSRRLPQGNPLPSALSRGSTRFGDFFLFNEVEISVRAVLRSGNGSGFVESNVQREREAAA
jgi:hypothetical protein